jgi:ABC-2 family transporter protein
MIWVSWRRQRLQLITLLGILVVGTGVIALLRSLMVDDITSLQIAQCVTQDGPECSGTDPVSLFKVEWLTRLNLAQAAILGFPLLIGVFVGAPLFARELEQGTHVLAFTQSVSRSRWMLSKLVVALAPALIVLITLQLSVSWWLSAAGKLGPLDGGPFAVLNFPIQHVSPVVYALFAFALGTFVGVVSRRTLVAMTVVFAAFIAVRFVLYDLVNRLVAAQRIEVLPNEGTGTGPGSTLTIDRGWLDTAGREISSETASPLIQACKSAPGGTPRTQEEFLACLPQSGLAKQYVSFIPESQAWQVHLVDASIFGGLAILLLAGTAWVLRRQS